MQGGDIDNTTPPRFYIVFEGTLAQPRESLKKGILRRVLGDSLKDWDFDHEVTQLVWDRWQRLGVRFDCITFSFDADDLQAKIDNTNLPIHTTWNFRSRDAFIKQLPYMPWVAAVIDHAAPMAYGGRGISLTAVR
jgi:hypothetical protein